MDHELEEQINELVSKITKDLQVKIIRLVGKFQNKKLKEQARSLKTNNTVTTKVKHDKPTNKKNDRKTSSKNDDKRDSDSDSYYSD